MLKAQKSDETGFGIIEIVISMFLLGLLAIAFLPLLVQSLRVSVSNSTLATSTQLVAQEMEEVRALESICGTIKNHIVDTNAKFSTTKFDADGQALQPQIEPIVCPPEVSFPTTVKVRVWVTDSRDKTISEATTLVLVES